MNNIIDPVNGNSYDIFSFEGKNLLKNYVKAFQSGGGSLYRVSSSDNNIGSTIDDYEVQTPTLKKKINNINYKKNYKMNKYGVINLEIY